MTETLIRGDHETLRNTITVSGGTASLTDAESVQWFLTDHWKVGSGEVALQKDDGDASLTVTDESTVEVELTPEETEQLETQTYYAELTATWDGDPSTCELEPGAKVVDSTHRQQ